MIHVDLFSGIGGFALACDWAGIETVCFCEIDKFCQKVLRKHYPNVPIVEDVNDIEAIKRIVTNTQGVPKHELERRIIQECDDPCGENRVSQQLGRGAGDSLLLTAGFPCQPFSCAGRRKGKTDDRYLWPQTMAVISALRPDWICLENVSGILSMVFPDSETGVASQASFLSVPADEIADYDTISGGLDRDLRQAGYETLWLVIPACGVGAPHRRDRVFIVAHNDSPLHRPREYEIRTRRHTTQLYNQEYETACAFGDTKSTGQPSILSRQGISQQWTESWTEVATRFCRVDDGIPNRVDRLKALGNAIVPQAAYEVIRTIKESDECLG